MTDKHKHPPVAYRPSEENRLWLKDRHDATGTAVNAIINEAVAGLRQRCEADVTRGLDGSAVRSRAIEGERP